jgi:hypothetical protein
MILSLSLSLSIYIYIYIYVYTRARANEHTNVRVWNLIHSAKKKKKRECSRTVRRGECWDVRGRM